MQSAVDKKSGWEQGLFRLTATVGQELELGQSLQMTLWRPQLSQGIPCDCAITHQKKRKELEMPPGADSIKATQRRQSRRCTDGKRAMRVRVQTLSFGKACICAVNIRKDQEWL